MTPTASAAGRLLAIAVLALALAAAVRPAPAAAVQEHLFDPCLSLTGSTETSGLDECPDPGPTHPKEPFFWPSGVATDRFGDIYVANYNGFGGEGSISVFNPTGEFILEIDDPNGPTGLAVDSQCNVFTLDFGPTNNTGGQARLIKYELGDCPPTPTSGVSGPVTILEPEPEKEVFNTNATAVAVDPTNDHLYTTGSLPGGQKTIREFAPGGETLLRTIPVAPNVNWGLDVCGRTGDIVVASRDGSKPIAEAGEVAVLAGADGQVKQIFDGAETPEGTLSSLWTNVAVDQLNCDIYVAQVISGREVVDQFSLDEDGTYRYVGQLTHTFRKSRPVDVAVDDPVEEGEPEYSSPNAGYVYVTSGTETGPGHLYAFAPRTQGPPEVKGESVSDIGSDSAVLRAEVRPNALPTTYRFEYGTGDCALGPCRSIPVPDASAGEGGGFVEVT